MPRSHLGTSRGLILLWSPVSCCKPNRYVASYKCTWSVFLTKLFFLAHPWGPVHFYGADVHSCSVFRNSSGFKSITRWIDRITSLVVLFFMLFKWLLLLSRAVMLLEYFAVSSYSTSVGIKHQFYDWLICSLFNMIMFYKCTYRLHCATLFLRTNIIIIIINIIIGIIIIIIIIIIVIVVVVIIIF